VLQVTERALNSGTATVEGAEPFGVSRDARAERRGLAPISAGRGEPEKDGGEDQEDDADARRVTSEVNDGDCQEQNACQCVTDCLF
jgi:hypothetical protein